MRDHITIATSVSPATSLPPSMFWLRKPESAISPHPLATTKRFKFLFVGGTISRKGPDVLLKAYLANFTAADDVCLVIKDFGGKSVYAGQTLEAQIKAAQAIPTAPEIRICMWRRDRAHRKASGRPQHCRRP